MLFFLATVLLFIVYNLFWTAVIALVVCWFLYTIFVACGMEPKWAKVLAIGLWFLPQIFHTMFWWAGV